MCYDTELQNIQPQISRFIRSRIFNSSDACDVIQNTNIVLLNKRKDFIKSKPFSNWAMRIASFQIKAYLTKIKRNRLDFLDEEWKSDEVHFDDAICKDKKRIDYNKQLQKKIGIGRKKLTIRENEVLSLTLKGYRLVDVSSELNIKPSHACMYKKRAVQKIKHFLKTNNKI